MAAPTRDVLRTRAQSRADMLPSTTATSPGFVSTTEWNAYLDQAASELYDVILDADEMYSNLQTTITMVSGVDVYPLPADLYHLQGVYWMNSTRRMFPLRRFNYHEIGYASGIFAPLITGSPRAYSLVGQNLWFYPLPAASGVVQIQYAPQYVQFPDDSTPLSFLVAQGWEEYIVVGAAIRALQKEQTDATLLMAELVQLKDRVKKRASNRDQFEPRHVRDISWTTNRFRRHKLGGG